MAVTRGGIPIRVWCWPGNTNDSALIRQVKDDQLLETLTERIDGSDALADQKRTALAAGLPAGLRRFLRSTPAGKLRVDRAAVAAEERQVPAAHLRPEPCPPKTSRSATSSSSTSNAAGGT